MNVLYTGWHRETVKFEIIRKKLRKLTKLYLILKMCSKRVEISLGITYKLRQLSAVHFAVSILFDFSQQVFTKL
jgi:hypothetical protein